MHVTIVHIRMSLVSLNHTFWLFVTSGALAITNVQIIQSANDWHPDLTNSRRWTTVLLQLNVGVAS